jgi:L-threonine kinase
MTSRISSAIAQDTVSWNRSLPICGEARAPATCGELVQGFLNGRDFLINSPIALFATVNVSLNDGGRINVRTPGIYTKVARVVRETLQHLGLHHLGADIDISSAIPRGKGLASSTSELTAAIFATMRAASRSLAAADVARIVIEVDKSSDGVFLPGITMCDHLTGELLESFGNPPPLSFVIVDTGGEIETIGFERERARAVAKANSSKLEQAVALLRRGFRHHDARLVAQAASLSAEVNQDVLYQPLLLDLLAGTAAFGGLGVNCAHTGTVLGVMYNPTETNLDHLLARISSLVGRNRVMGRFPLIPGRSFGSNTEPRD